MKKKTRIICVVLAIVLGLILGMLFQRTPDISTWQESVRSHVAQEIEKFTQEDVERAYAEAKVHSSVMEHEAAKPKDVTVVKQWIMQFVTEDMEPFIREVVQELPETSQKKTWEHATAAKLPNIVLKHEPWEAGSTNRYDTIWLSPALIDSYDELRGVLSHELVHYWVQRVRFKESVEIGEGITEYLTINAFESLGWELGLLKYEDDELLEENTNNESIDKRFAKVEQSIRIMDKQSQHYPMQTSAASILMCLDQENMLLAWYLGEADASFQPYRYSEQLLEQQKIDGKDARAWIETLKNSEDYSEKASQEFDTLIRAGGEVTELNKRWKICMSNLHASGFIAAHLARNFHEIQVVLNENNFEPLEQDVWDDLLASSVQKIKENVDDSIPQSKDRITFYFDRILGMLKLAMYEDLPIVHTQSNDSLQKIFFSDIKANASRSETINAVSERIRIVLLVELIKADERVNAEGFKEEEKQIETLNHEIEMGEKKYDRSLETITVLLETVSQHRDQLVDLLQSAGVDSSALFAERGMPQCFLEDIEAVTKNRK